MAGYIQLYLDNDYIIPIGVAPNGDCHKYCNQLSVRRFWLYFTKNTPNGRLESSELCKANFESGQEGFYGDFWQHVQNDDSVAGEPYTYIDLLELSSVITDIRDWSRSMLYTETPEVVLNFSVVIPLKARKKFAEFIEEKIGNVRSYSVDLNDLLASKVLFDNRTITPAFGDQLMVIQSSGSDILLSVMTWCGGSFMQGEESLRLHKKGSDYLKKALAKMVVDKYERTNHMLLLNQMENEYLYQMQFADKWLKTRDAGDSIWIDGFAYAFDPTKRYASIEIDGKLLDTYERDAIRGTINRISEYYSNNITGGHLHTILLGDVFREKVFLDDCVSITSSDEKFTLFNDNAVQEAMSRYYVNHSSLKESLSNFERWFMDIQNKRARISSYVHNAEKLSALKDDTDKAATRLNEAILSVKSSNDTLLQSWNALMRKSDFDESEKVVGRMSFSDELKVANSEAFEVLRRVETNNSLLIELEQEDEIKPVILKVRESTNLLRQLRETADKLNEMPNTLKEKIRTFRDKYPSYLELKQKFKSEHTLSGKRNIVEQMRGLTMEELPVLDVENIKGNIVVNVVSDGGGFLGFGAKKAVSVVVRLDKPLPCRGVLVISQQMLPSIPKGRAGVYAVDVEKGAEGEALNFKESLDKLGIDKKAKTLYVKFWPHEDENIPINRFEINGGGSIDL